MTERRANLCVLRDGRHVDPCAAVSRLPFRFVQELDHRTRQPSRSFVAVECDGALVALPACPFCGLAYREATA